MHSQGAENNLEADERGPLKRKGVRCLYIHLYYRSVLKSIVIGQENKWLVV